MKDKIKKVLEDLTTREWMSGEPPRDSSIDESTAKLLELMREIVPKKKDDGIEGCDTFGYCSVEGYNTCREEMLKKLKEG